MSAQIDEPFDGIPEEDRVALRAYLRGYDRSCLGAVGYLRRNPPGDLAASLVRHAENLMSAQQGGSQ